MIKRDNIKSENIKYKIVARQISLFDEGFKELLNKASFRNKKKYVEVVEKIDPTLIISIVIGKIISFVVKYPDITIQPVTSLIINIGNIIVELHNLFYGPVTFIFLL